MFIVVYCNHSYIYIQSNISFIIIGSMGVSWGWWDGLLARQNNKRKKKSNS